MRNSQLLTAVESLLDEGHQVLTTEFKSGPLIAVELQTFAKWRAGCTNLLRLLGDAGQQWTESLSGKQNSVSTATRMLGTLEGIRDAIVAGLLVRFEDLVSAEVFGGLLDQADYLLAEGYFLAAGVLGRAVLEEHLRNWSDHAGCSPAKAKLTLNDFNHALYKAKAYNVSVMKHVDSLAAIGNDAAHNKPDLSRDGVSRLLRDVREFLAKHSFA